MPELGYARPTQLVRGRFRRSSGLRRPLFALRPHEPENTGCGAQLQDEATLVRGQGLEVVRAVEARRVVVDRVGHDHSPARRACRGDDRAKRVNEQLGAESPSVQALIEGQLGQQNRRDSPRGAVTQASRRALSLDEMRSQGEVAGELRRARPELSVAASERSGPSRGRPRAAPQHTPQPDRPFAWHAPGRGAGGPAPTADVATAARADDPQTETPHTTRRGQAHEAECSRSRPLRVAGAPLYSAALRARLHSLRRA